MPGSLSPAEQAVNPTAGIPAPPLGETARIAALESQLASILMVREAPLNVKDPRFGAKGDDSTDDTAAVAAAFALLPANGGEVFFPPGGYRLSAFPNLDSKRSIVIRGCGGQSGGAAEATRLIKTGGGAADFISARSSIGVEIEKLAIMHEAGFSGWLVNGELLTTDTAYLKLRDVTLSKTAAAGRTAKGLKLVKAISGEFGVVFRDLDVGIQGRALTTDYSNLHQFNCCKWIGMGTAPVQNIGNSWQFNVPTVQQLASGNAAFITRAPGFFSNGGGIHDGWCGDTLAAATGEWIQWAGNGFKIDGMEFGYCTKAVVVNDVTTPVGCRGFTMTGNQMNPSNTGLHLVGPLGFQRNHLVAGNNWNGSGLTMDNLPYYSLIYGDTGLVASLDFMETVGSPPAPVANGSRLYTIDNGSGKTQFRLRTDSADNTVFTSA